MPINADILPYKIQNVYLGMSGLVFWVPGLVFWVSGLVFYVSGLRRGAKKVCFEDLNRDSFLKSKMKPVVKYGVY